MTTYDAIEHDDLGHELAAYGAPTIVPANNVPAITNVTPTEGSTVSTTQAIGCDVTDADGSGTFTRIILTITLATGTEEVVHNGDAFVYPYTVSTRSAITDGYRYAIVRTGGWPRGARFTLTPYAIDAAGDEAP